MKITHYVTLVFITVLSLPTRAQQNFVWNKVDAVQKNKQQLYSDIKLAIAESWDAPGEVIVDDDKEGGVISVRGTVSLDLETMLSNNTYWYSYHLTFYMKDNKYKLALDQVYCYDARYGANNMFATPIQPFNVPYSGNAADLPVKKKDAESLMTNLQAELGGLFQRFTGVLAEPSKISNW